MARVKIDARKTEGRINDVVTMMRDQGKEYPYITGFLEVSLDRALALLPVGKRQEFLADLEKAVRPKTRKVRNLMTGTEIEIDYDTPRSCDPSSELYWSI